MTARSLQRVYTIISHVHFSVVRGHCHFGFNLQHGKEENQ